MTNSAGKQQDQHIAAARRRLVHLAGLAAQTAASERKILAAAQDRLAAVTADLETLRPRVHLDDDAGADYQRLTLERGQLATVIARAEKVLAP